MTQEYMMDKFIQKIYLSEIIKQANRAIHSATTMNQCLENRSDQEDFFREADHFLQHAASISQLLWPCRSKTESADRGKYLRKLLNVEDDNILKNRDLRDHIVHFDERLDTWATLSKKHNFVDQCIGDVNKMIRGVDQADIMRHYNSANNEYSFSGEKFNIKDILDTINEIKEAAEKYSNNRDE